MTNDLWLTPEIPGYQEVREFQLRYARKLGEIYGSAISNMTASLQAQMKPGQTQGLGEMAKGGFQAQRRSHLYRDADGKHHRRKASSGRLGGTTPRL